MGYRKLTPGEVLEREANAILADDRREHCTSMACKTHFYLDKQLDLRQKKEDMKGLKL